MILITFFYHTSWKNYLIWYSVQRYSWYDNITLNTVLHYGGLLLVFASLCTCVLKVWCARWWFDEPPMVCSLIQAMSLWSILIGQYIHSKRWYVVLDTKITNKVSSMAAELKGIETALEHCICNPAAREKSIYLRILSARCRPLKSSHQQITCKLLTKLSCRFRPLKKTWYPLPLDTITCRSFGRCCRFS